MYMLEMRNIFKSFGGVKALSDVSMSIRPGEVRALVGENGAGKSTLMKVLAGAVKKDSGIIAIKGKQVDYDSPRQALEHGISVIYQELNMVPDLTVAENIFMDHIPTKNGFVNWKEMNQRSGQLLKELGIQINPKEKVGHLTVARQQMVEIAKAIKNKSQVVVFDEPSAVLGAKDSEILFQRISDLKNQGISVIYISHRLDEIMQITDSVTVLRDGQNIITKDTKDLTMEDIVSYMTGKDYRSIQQTAGYVPNHNEIVFEVRNLNRDNAIKDVSFHIRKGEVLGLAGLVGSGRSEIARAIFGADPKTGGEIFIKGKKVAIRSPRDACRLGIGFVMEDRKTQGLHLKMPIFQNITMTQMNRYRHWGLVSNKQEYDTVNDFKKKLLIKTENIKNPVLSLSGGNQQKVSIAKWLHIQPDILFLDEPTRGVDVGAKSEIYKLIEDIKAQGKAILLISSEFAEILSLSDRVMVIKRGEVAGEFTREQMQADSSILEAL